MRDALKTNLKRFGIHCVQDGAHRHLNRKDGGKQPEAAYRTN
jgi:hypothetical protein